MDSLGNIYTTNYGSSTVTKITPAGVSTSLASTGLNTNPRGITIDAAGNLYTANYSRNTVTKITPEGSTSNFGSTGSRPEGITIDSAGNIYTANFISSNVTKISPPAGNPVVVTNAQTVVGNQVTFNGNVTSENGSSVTQRGFVYDTTPNPTYSNIVLVSGSGPGAFSATASGLLAGTYYARSFATNSIGTSYGSEISFTVNAALLEQTITFPAISDAVVGSTSTSANATASSGTNVLYRSNTNSVCTIFEGYWNTPGPMPITLLGVGTCSITAMEEGDATYAPAADVTRTFNVTAVANNNAAAEAARIAAEAAAAKKAKEQRELTEILSLIPELGKLSLGIGETSKALTGTKCVKGKTIKYVFKGEKCPKGFTKRK